MSKLRLSRPAQIDIAYILATSAARWGPEARQRYEAMLAAAMRTVGDDPFGLATRDRSNLLPGLRSIHLRHAHSNDPEATVRNPVHVLYCRAPRRGLIEIIRVLHDRMEPSRHLGSQS